jgi:hypothetical protein
MPANPDYEPINGDHSKILGRVVTIMRKLYSVEIEQFKVIKVERWISKNFQSSSRKIQLPQ